MSKKTASLRNPFNCNIQYETEIVQQHQKLDICIFSSQIFLRKPIVKSYIQKLCSEAHKKPTEIIQLCLSQWFAIFIYYNF